MIDEYLGDLEELLDATRKYYSDIKPSEWYEQNMIMPTGSAFPGRFSFNQTPYWREPLDCLHRDHPTTHVSIMKSAQSGGSAAILNPIVGYTIAQNPGNMMFLTGHAELSNNAFLKIDQVIDNCGLRELIGPTIMRAKSSRTGDTSKMKEYPGGSLVGGSVTNHNLLRQYDIMIMIVDDFDAAPMSSKSAGSTRMLVDQRTASFAYKKKIFYVSSPQIKGLSNIEDVFECGDQRFYKVPCPMCGEFIKLEWSIAIDEKETGGITWKLDKNGNLDRRSVGYVCQKCSQFFTDSQKYEMNLAGFWEPTCIPKEENHWSYQLSSLYAPVFMDNWATNVQKYINANPNNGTTDEKKQQTFVNVVLGETYEKKGASPKADNVQRNIRNYKVGTVPEWLSQKPVGDGNGKLILLTCAADLNGTENDARLDYEVVAWSETGSSYSVTHGSIGTFIPREGSMKVKRDRDRWTYVAHQPKSVWPEFEKVLATIFLTDTGRKMKIVISGIDCGHYTTHAYDFIDRTNFNVIGVRGDKEFQYRKIGIDLPVFKPARERTKLYMLDVNYIKDIISQNIDLQWQYNAGEVQPPGFMNYPTPEQGLYLLNNFFIHYQAEHRQIETKEGEGVGSRWVKKHSNDQNHMWDCRIYNYALREIFADMTLRLCKPPRKGNWHDFVEYGKLNKIW